MAKRSRTSPLKRQREAEKRERQAKRVAKSALKRERGFKRAESSPEATSNEDLRDDSVGSNGPAARHIAEEQGVGAWRRRARWSSAQATKHRSDGGFRVRN
jgi:hypothetical protein